MDVKRVVKEAFSVIGKEGSTMDGEGFIQRLWEDASGHFEEIAHLARKEKDGSFAGFWGAMTDISRSFQPWEEHFTKGLYLAGAEAEEDAQPPEGWTKWDIPGYEHICVKCEEPDTFARTLDYLKEQNLELAGAVHDFNNPRENGQAYMFFPIRRL